MSYIQMNNPQVVKNYVESQIKEGKGEVRQIGKLNYFVDGTGNQILIDNLDLNVEVKKEVKEVKEVKQDVKKEVKKEVKEEAKEEAKEEVKK